MAKRKTKKRPVDPVKLIEALTARVGGLEKELADVRALAAEKRLGAVRWLDTDEFAAVIKVAPKTLRRMCEKRRVPFHKVGAAVRFTPEDIDKVKRDLAVLRGDG